MNRAFADRRLAIVAAVLLFAVATLYAQDATPKPQGVAATDPLRAAVHGAIQKVYPALVRIQVVTVFYREGREFKSEASGSGVIISPDGYVITNHHVAGKSKRLQCTLSSKEELEAVLVGSDPLADIAVIKLDLTGRDPGKPLPVAKFGDSDKLRVGDRVLAMGSPLALTQSVTLGIVSNKEMMLPRFFGSFQLDGEDVGSLVKWIGHDAEIFPGNSGGPLVNLEGEIIGINDIGVGLGGAIPGNLSREVADEILKYGEVKRSWLGVAVQPLLKSSKAEKGILVSSVVPGSPADKAGLKAGDIIQSFNGNSFSIRYSEQVPEFNRLILTTPIGTNVKVAYERDGQAQETKATVVARGSAQGKETELKQWGVTVQELTLLAAKELKREPYSGLLVSSVRPGGASAEAKPALEYRDILTDVAGKSVRAIPELLALTEELTKDKTGPTPVLIGFERRTQKLLTVVKLGEPETPDRSADARKAWLPAQVQVLTPELAEALGLKGRKGVRLTEIFPDSTASKAGLQVGDLILKFDDTPLDVSRPEDAELFQNFIRQYRIGAKYKLEVVRAGKPMTIEVELAPTPGATRQIVEYHNTHFEFKARDIQFQDRVQRELEPTQTGALVTTVEGGGWAALARLRPGDLVLAVDGKPVANVADLREQMKRVEQTKPARVVVFVRRGIHTHFVELEPIWPTKQS